MQNIQQLFQKGSLSLVNKIKGIVFDLDDTIYSKEDVFLSVFDQFVFPFEYRNKVFSEYLSYSDQAFQAVEQHLISLEESHIWRVVKTFEHFGLTCSTQTAKDFSTHYVEAMKSIQLSKDWKEFFEWLVKQNIPLAILTNGPSHHQRNKLHALKLDRFIPEDAWFISEDLGWSKPHKNVFLAIEQYTQLTQAQLLMIGDNVQADILGAQQLNWKTIWYTSSKHNTPIRPSFICSHPIEIKQWLEEHWSN